MNSWLGWTTITRAELAAAQNASHLAQTGVRDEIGVSAVHFVYAERFFPGTSVQLTRLRYLFFVSALYELLRQKPTPSNLDEVVAQAERRLGFQLIAYHEKHKIPLEGSGIIGRTVIRSHPPVLLPSISYWTPLTKWGILAPDESTSQVPSRAAVHANWDRYRRGKGHRGEVDTRSHLFNFDLENHWIDGPKELQSVGNGSTPISFKLTSWEQTFLKRQLSSFELDRVGSKPLIAHLAQLSPTELAAVVDAEDPWSSPVVAALPAKHPDRETLQRARYAAHLVQVARAIYDLLVARLLRDHDASPLGAEWADQAEEHLRVLASPKSTTYELSMRVDLVAFTRDAELSGIPIDRGLTSLLGKLKEWLPGKSRNPELLRQLLKDREIDKKTKSRARLVPDARERRKDWTFAPARPLEYRWGIVSRLLGDLAGILT